jgi:superfamily II DNA or RNA helicase
MLRDYQEPTVGLNIAAIGNRKAVLNGMFTGAGKTVMFCEMARRIHGRTLILCHMRELVWQAVEKARTVAETEPDIEMADYIASEDAWCPARIVVASKQTLLSKRGGEPRYRRFTGFSVVHVDEAHMQFSEPVLEMLRWFQSQGAMICGWTATPFRMDGKSLMGFYEETLVNYDLTWAIDNGWACPPVCKLARVQELDLSGVSISGGDFNQGELAAAVEREAALHRIALITKEEMDGPTVVFTPSVASARGVAHYLRHNYGISADWVSGSMPEEDRQAALRRYKSGDTQVLVNCQVVAIGFDHPGTTTLILGRPTRSRSFWLQAVGRATRALGGTVDFAGSTPESRKQAIADSRKPRFKVVDCTDSSMDHRLVTAVDMFCTADAPVKEKVKRQAAEASLELTVEEIEALAQKELERRAIAEEIERRRALTTGQATGRVIGQDIDLRTGKRSVGTYRNPLRGKYANVKLSELPDHYVHWAANSVRGWPGALFKREWRRRCSKTF